MNIKTGILAAAAALTLTVPAAALAQPSYGHNGYDRGYSQPYDHRGDYRRIERERELRRAEELRRLRFERTHRYGWYR